MQVTGRAGFVDRQEAIHEARAALTGLREVLFQAPGATLTQFLGEVDDLIRLAGAARVAITAEAVERGEVQASTSPGTLAWVRAQAPAAAETGASDIAACAAAVNSRGDAAPIGAAVVLAEISPRTGATVLREMEKLRAEVEADAMPSVIAALLAIGHKHGPAGVRMVRPELLARFGSTAFQENQDRRAQRVELSRGIEDGGLHRYDLTLDNESRAILEAAIGPLCKPVPGPDGERDKRTFAQRRGQALIEALRRVMSSAVLPGASTKSTVVVTIDHEKLREAAGAGSALGGIDGGMLLGSETIRKLACDGVVMPVLVGKHGGVLDAGRAERYITREMLKALWLRDKQCTFPGCSAPAFWCDAHHLIHWADGGPTQLDLSALLCGGHHTIVHRDRLAGRVLDGAVVWDLTVGSYDKYLLEWRAEQAPPEPLDLTEQHRHSDRERQRRYGLTGLTIKRVNFGDLAA